ncbi:MAG: hypothetical protein IJP68_05555, partial [Selenomonadaceae bacterium]|nr:hypothetical protein [Selenomonadaceae bacterium]
MIGKREFGDYQTPLEFAAAICHFLNTERNVKPATILEPTCGIGNFLKAALTFDAEKYYGIEINPAYCKICAETVNDSRLEIICANFFEYDFSRLPKENLLIIGNPPWANNETLSKLNSANLPPKSNFKNLRGLDALTGASNFDICEYILLKLTDACRDTDTTLAMLCKTSTARNVFKELNRAGFNFKCFEIFEFDAAKIFGVSASACLLFIRLSERDFPQASCKIFSLDAPHELKNTLTIDDSDGEFYGKSCFEWRQGIKHDCSKIMELNFINNRLQNGLGENVDVEDEIIFPLIKSSMLKKAVIADFSKYVIVPQRHVNEDITHIESDFPKAWRYLNAHAEFFIKRKSTVYRGRQKFSVFGVGDYSFAKYKVVVSGFYKTPLFALTYSSKPVMTDDTTYFIGFETYDAAYTAMLLLNSGHVQNFLKGKTFLDAKRPYTKKILERLDFGKISAAISFEDLNQTERSIGLENYLS